MRIFRNQWITKFAKKHKISDSELIEAVERAGKGVIDADLGGGVIKQRIARQGQGRSGGYRSLIFFRHGERAFFMTAFAKNDRENITDKELAELKKAAAIILAMTETDIEQAKSNGTFTEIQP
ncbi:type II toxin-antitoxin system RelE/ParE family toxin [Neisseria sp. HMSC068C04]|uniref:type II toxin-antitoxin system RelE/ParE family toxin n=1 Tax=Neisseria sp. HMSC068C04 TaxID=1715179 RepID=UPI0008A26F86|nr:type II toxin-antitoxin system RelE/ParE family toxin [Neisseria sp. HMSC068C04]OFM31396.1 addiction module toxin RelE [Neisseria sp. HMSC068C04]